MFSFDLFLFGFALFLGIVRFSLVLLFLGTGLVYALHGLHIEHKWLHLILAILHFILLLRMLPREIGRLCLGFRVTRDSFSLHQFVKNIAET